MLGYDSVLCYPSSAFLYGEASHDTTIWMDKLQCNGNETALDLCNFPAGWGVHNCNHYDDAGLVCRNDSK